MFSFFFKQKTAYEMRISDWSSDVCSSDLRDLGGARHLGILLGDRQAAFLIDAMLLRKVGEDRVDEHAGIADHALALFVLGIGLLQVDDQDALRHPDLNRRKARKSTRLNSSH